MPTIKKFTKKDLDKIKLTKVKSGDQDNGNIISYLESNEDAKLKAINNLIAGRNSNKNPLTDLIESIWNQPNIDDDNLRKIAVSLSFFDVIKENTVDPEINNPNAIYFAALVNWNVTRGKGSASDRLKSVSAINSAKEISPELDYREYLSQVGNNSDSKFNNEYKNITIAPANYSSDMILKLPIIKGPLGTFKFAINDKISAKLVFDTDKECNEYNVPFNIWISMVKDGVMKKNKSVRFYPYSNLSKIVDTSNNFILDILKLNDFKKRYSFPSMYDLEYNADGHIVLSNTRVAPDLEENTYGLEWKPLRKNASVQVLKCKKFYLAYNSNAGVIIYMP